MAKPTIRFAFKGGPELARKLSQLGSAAPLVAAESLYQSATDIMGRSQTLVPVETGTLRASGFVALPSIQGSQVEVRLGYGGPARHYALAVHENPRAGKTGGKSPSGHPYKRWAKTGQWKYLETPVKEGANAIVETLRMNVERKHAEISRGGR